jgi:fatty-acyl-CoA synthase
MRNQGLGSWTARRARMAPDRVALRHQGRSWTYGELDRRSTALAHGLRELGAGHGDRVAYLGPNHPTFLETLFAAGALGAIFVPLSTRLAGPELERILEDAAAGVLVYAPSHREVVSSIRSRLAGGHLVAVDGAEPGALGYEDLLAAGGPPIDEPVGLDDTCLLVYTSGTTGRPKGVMLSHGNLTWNCYNVLIDIDLPSDAVTLVSAPLFHMAALGMTCLPTLLKGGTAVLMGAFDPERAFDLIEAERVTMMFGVPSMFNALAQSPRWDRADLSSVRILMCGGAPVPESTIRTWQRRGLVFLQGYGMTEAAPGVLFLGEAEGVRKAGTAGVPSFFTDVRVVRPDGSAASPGSPGEIVVRGPNVSSGYWRRPQETAEAFSEDGWFRSGDVAVVDHEGYFRIVDRLKDMIISGGENVYPAEVEKALHGHEAVADCAVIGVPDERWGEVGKALVVLRPGAEAKAEDLLTYLQGRLARYKIPKHVEWVESLPRSASGKLLKVPLRERYGTPPG